MKMIKLALQGFIIGIGKIIHGVSGARFAMRFGVYEKALRIISNPKKELKGNVAIKVHSGEPGNQNFLRPDFWSDIIELVGGTIVECNTAYEGRRNTTKSHLETFKEHGWNAYTSDTIGTLKTGDVLPSVSTVS